MADTSIPVITIDGPSGSGKGTVSRRLAQIFHWHFLDSGAIYRALAFAAIKHRWDLKQRVTLARHARDLDLQFEFNSDTKAYKILLENQDISKLITDENIGMFASKIATFPLVREVLLVHQRRFKQEPGLIADGRDMGTIVFPEAICKFFITASLSERTQRRLKQLQQQGKLSDFSSTLAKLSRRDHRDQQRTIAPLKPATDAILIDTTGLTVEQVIKQMLAKIPSQSIIKK